MRERSISRPPASRCSGEHQGRGLHKGLTGWLREFIYRRGGKPEFKAIGASPPPYARFAKRHDRAWHPRPLPTRRATRSRFDVGVRYEGYHGFGDDGEGRSRRRQGTPGHYTQQCLAAGRARCGSAKDSGTWDTIQDLAEAGRGHSDLVSARGRAQDARGPADPELRQAARRPLSRG